MQAHHEHTEISSVAGQHARAEHVEAVAVDPYASRRLFAQKVIQGIYLLFGTIEALILIRFALFVLGANPAAPFARFMYGITAVFVAPFAGLFPTYRADGFVLEPHALIAVVIYALVAWLLGKLVWLMVGDTRSAVSTSTRTLNTRD